MKIGPFSDLDMTKTLLLFFLFLGSGTQKKRGRASIGEITALLINEYTVYRIYIVLGAFFTSSVTRTEYPDRHVEGREQGLFPGQGNWSLISGLDRLMRLITLMRLIGLITD